MTFLSMKSGSGLLRLFRVWDQNRPLETCQMHQISNNQSRRQVAIPINDTGDGYPITGADCFDGGIVCPSGQRREHNTLCHRTGAYC